MHILRVKDDDGVWHDIPAIIGPPGIAGPQGPDGQDGQDGADGYSPTVTVTDITGGHRVTITDAEGDHTFDVMDGQGGGGGTSDYSDLTNKPQINSHTLSGNQSAADLGLGTYSKPSGGIPDTDLSSDVQASLGKADTALQSYTETDPTVPSWAKASSKPSYTKSEVGLGNVDNVQQYSASNPPPYPVSSVNGQTGAVSLSIPSTAADVGAIAAPASPASGNVLRYNGSAWAASTLSASDVGAEPAVTEVTVSTAGAVTQALDPGKIYHFTGALTALTITLNAASAGQVAQYHFDFNSGSTAPTLTLPNSVTMPSGFSVDASKHYEIDILNGYGVAMAW